MAGAPRGDRCTSKISGIAMAEYVIRVCAESAYLLHLNFIDTFHGASPKQFQQNSIVVSLRNLSAFAILNSENGAPQRVVRGSFVQQHSVHHLSGSKFLIFDNHGGNLDGGPSRLLEVDIERGEERTIFPNPSTPIELRTLFSDTAGYVDISSDRKRSFVSFSHAGIAVEVEIATGRVLTIYRNCHAFSHSESAGRWSSKGVFLVLWVCIISTECRRPSLGVS